MRNISLMTCIKSGMRHLKSERLKNEVLKTGLLKFGPGDSAEKKVD